ncbi:unnamed protein product [Calypogeia fissa]
MDPTDAEELLRYVDERPSLLEMPFGYVCAMQRLACTIVGDMPSKPNLTSSCPDHTWCSINGYRVSIDQFRGLVKALIRNCTRLMEDEVLMGLDTSWILRELEGGTIMDELNKMHAGYSFATDERNKFHEHKHDLLNHLFTDGTTSSHFIHAVDETGKILWKKKSMRCWKASTEKLAERLVVLFHFVLGQPHRSIEYESFLILNTGTNERTLYWSDETLVTFQSYNKMCNSSKAKPVKLVCRFLPLCLRQLYLQYFCIIRPAEVFVAGELWGAVPAALYRDCWFVRWGKWCATHHFSDIMESEFFKHCSASFRVKQYRHLAKFFCEPIRAHRTRQCEKRLWMHLQDTLR